MADEHVEKSRKGRGLKWALGLSLALNLIIVGFVAGAIWRFTGPEAPHRQWRGDTTSYGTPFVRALPREAKRAMYRQIREDAKSLPSRADRRALYQDVLSELRADTFDRAAIEGLFAQQAETAQAVLKQAQSGWIDIVSQMDPDERRAVATRLEEALNRGPKRKPAKP